MTEIITNEKRPVSSCTEMLRGSGDANCSRKFKNKSNQMQLSLSGLETLAAAQVTHQGGKGEPFHDWYPYLEGFSSEFVKFVLAKYMPNAKR
ncbi:hypothetical protein P4129_27265 [Pseudomonas aeruginosa]|nr:hypothetical protein [Pseudomonas aeruginosa]